MRGDERKESYERRKEQKVNRREDIVERLEAREKSRKKIGKTERE